jgi:hypothetical protein
MCRLKRLCRIEATVIPEGAATATSNGRAAASVGWIGNRISVLAQ